MYVNVRKLHVDSMHRTVVGTICDYKALFNVTFNLHSPPPLIFNHDHKGSQEGGSIR